MLHILCCAKLLLDPKSKIACLNVASFLGRRASIFFLKTLLKPATGGNIFFDFLKAKNEEIFKTIFMVTMYRLKTVLTALRKRHKRHAIMTVVAL